MENLESSVIYRSGVRDIYDEQNSLLFRRQDLQLCLTLCLRMQLELNGTNAFCQREASSESELLFIKNKERF